MKDEDKTKEQLIDELVELRQRVAELEALETEHKQVEEALRDTNELLEKIFSTTHLLIAYMDTDFSFIRVNRAYAEADGREPEVFVGKNHFDLYPNEENEAIFRRVVETVEPYTAYAKPFEYAGHPERGVTYWDWDLHPVKDDFGKVEGLVLCLVNVTERVKAEEELRQHRDHLEELVTERTAELTAANEQLQREITERKRAEEALRESEEKYRDLVENINDIIYAIDKNGVVTYVSPVVESFMGYTPSEVTGRSFADFIYQEDLQRIGKSFRRVLSGHIEASEYRVLTKSGEIRWMRTSSQPTFSGDRIIGVQGVLADITERKRVEEALRQYTVELEARNEELDAFAHTVAHDLKTPLGHIVGFAQVLEKNYSALPEEELRHYLRTMVQSGRKMSNIIDELLLLAGVRKMEEMELGPLDMAGIVDEAQRRLAYLIEEHRAEIILPDAWPVALGYGPWVEEVWVNYLNNAIEYGGRPPRVELGATVQADDQVCFWVRDNGPGLTPEEQARLFTPSTQLAPVRTKGHGLGLSIVRRIVEKFGGQVGVESEVGRGSVFTFTLPGMAT